MQHGQPSWIAVMPWGGCLCGLSPRRTDAATHCLQATVAGFGLVSRDNVFRVRTLNPAAAAAECRTHDCGMHACMHVCRHLPTRSRAERWTNMPCHTPLAGVRPAAPAAGGQDRAGLPQLRPADRLRRHEGAHGLPAGTSTPALWAQRRLVERQQTLRFAAFLHMPARGCFAGPGCDPGCMRFCCRSCLTTVTAARTSSARCSAWCGTRR